MAAADYQVENIDLDSRTRGRIHSASKKTQKLDYYKSNIGEANYRKACGLLAYLLETKAISVKKARVLLRRIETELRVDRGAVSLEVMLAKSSLQGSKFTADKNKKMKSISAKDALKGCDFGVKTVNYRVKVKKGGKHLF